MTYSLYDVYLLITYIFFCDVWGIFLIVCFCFAAVDEYMAHGNQNKFLI